MFPDCINELIECFKRFPGVGQKSAERMAFSLINDFDDESLEMFGNSVNNIKKKIKKSF